MFAALHRDRGVNLQLQTQVEEITRADGADDKATGVKMRDRSTVAADAVLVAVGTKTEHRTRRTSQAINR